jgi:hypothetical protein
MVRIYYRPVLSSGRAPHKKREEEKKKKEEKKTAYV